MIVPKPTNKRNTAVKKELTDEARRISYRISHDDTMESKRFRKTSGERLAETPTRVLE